MLAVGRSLRRLWIPLVLVVALALAGLVITRLHRKFASEDLNAGARAGIDIVAFNPKVVVYEVFGPPEATATISYFDADANVHTVGAAALPWSVTISTTLPAMTANLMAQTDRGRIGCRITVDDVVRDERTAEDVTAQTFCLVKSA